MIYFAKIYIFWLYFNINVQDTSPLYYKTFFFRLRNAYHGMSPYLMGLTALSTWHYQVPRGFGMHNTMNPDVYRGPWGGKHCRDSIVQVCTKFLQPTFCFHIWFSFFFTDLYCNPITMECQTNVYCPAKHSCLGGDQGEGVDHHFCQQ